MTSRKFGQHVKKRAAELTPEADKPVTQVAKDLGISAHADWRRRRHWLAEAWAILYGLLAFAGCTAWIVYRRSWNRSALRPVPERRPSHAKRALRLVPEPGPSLGKHRQRPDRWATWGAARNGARVVLTGGQKGTLLALAVVGLILLVVRPRDVLIAFLGVVTALYLATGIYKIRLLVRGERAISHGAAASAPATGEDLPPYTVLVPLNRESKILPVLLQRLKSINYPRDRLEILLLIECDDEETQHAVGKCRYLLEANLRIVTMPPGQPRTKPRALNVGLNEAHGEYIVIYDAEDEPDPDQLRKAVAMFGTVPQNVVCLQARLNFYNSGQSILTRLFAVDYAAWYDQMLPGLAYTGHSKSGAFLPLGGTSNHLRVKSLLELGGWDPFNVTEDCDLGARLGRAGMQVAMLDSVTWEEAVPRIRPWIRQRSRWVKGYIQSYFVHMRNPLSLLRQLGPRGFTDFQMLVGGSTLVLLLNPLLWMLTMLYIVSAAVAAPLHLFIQSLFPAPLYYPSLICLTLGNFIFFYCNAYVCVRHDYIGLTRYALLIPFYWVLLSIGSWAGLYSLLRRPYYWAKTEHGVSMRQPDTPVAAESA